MNTPDTPAAVERSSPKDRSASPWNGTRRRTDTAASVASLLGSLFGDRLVWSLFKRSVIGSYHQVSAKHLDAYLDEFEWRFNNRKNPYLFRDTLLKLIESDSLPYEQLTA